MNCKELNIELCLHCKEIDLYLPCIVADLDACLAKNINNIKDIVYLALKEGVYYGPTSADRVDIIEVERCMAVLIKRKYKEYEYLLVLI